MFTVDQVTKRGCDRCAVGWLHCRLVDQTISGTFYCYIDILKSLTMKSWDLSDLALDAPPPSDTAVAALPSGGSAASSSGTSPALFSTPATTATGSTGGVF